MTRNVLIIDNYDSFVYNVARYFTQLGYITQVMRNDAISLSDISLEQYSHIVISPGPCSPTEAGISIDVVKQFYKTIPILGICLGHQVIGHVFNAQIKHAHHPMHGQSSEVTHDGAGLFHNTPSPLQVGRYHSLIVDDTTLSDEICITSRSAEGEIMSIQHKQFPVFGVQFHPEAILTLSGYELIKNFCNYSGL